ncbi:MAG: BamA/TamA family outer membrane protein [Elusimicrobiales bacterium]|nr:BamA/TamA family outer membrane protein [Elusimicrobiales bacterium]
MPRRPAAICLALLFLLGAAAHAQAPAKKKRKLLVKPPIKAREELVKPEAKTKEDIIKTAERPAPPKEGLLGRVLNAITIDTPNGPLIPFPVVDSSKDLGPSFGIMPVVAIRKRGTNEIKSVLVPSVNYNENLRTTLTYRHYIFPDDKRYFILRASRSERVERELMAYYYTPDVFASGFRLSLEAKHWVTGKPSFYGYGINSKRGDKANYSLQTTGEEVIADLPLIKHLFFNFNHSYFDKRIGVGPVNGGQVNVLFPADYAVASELRTFHTNRFSLVYDDTDHPFLPKIGTYASASVLYSNKKLGSDYEYRTYALQVKHYYNYKEESRYVTAAHYLLQFQRGEALPFHALPQLGESTGLRMAGDGRFTDRGKFVFTIEERITLSKTPFYKFISETEIAPFLDIGTVFPKVSAFRARDLKYGPGISARLVIRPQLVATVDFAYGSEGTNAIIRIGYPF